MLKAIGESLLSAVHCVQAQTLLTPGPSTEYLRRSLVRCYAKLSDTGRRYRPPRRVELPAQTGALPTLTPGRQLDQRFISPHIYSEKHSAWQELSLVQSHQNRGTELQRNSLLKVVSWNIDFASSGPMQRAAAAVKHLQRTFGDDPGQLVIFLQEVCQGSLQQILQTRWVQQGFVIAGHEPPRTFQAGVPRPARYFTLVMTPRCLRLESSFRMPLPTEMGRDALFVDVPLCPANQRFDANTKDVLRLGTTHLESLGDGAPLRTRQLELISQELSEDRSEPRVVAGLVGGDMNAIFDVEQTLHKRMGLKDAWEDASPAHQTSSERDEAGSSCGRISGHTWGYQSEMTGWKPKRFDKFLYTGCIETVPLTETQEFGGQVGRLGIGLTADVPLKAEHLGQQMLESEVTTQKAWVSDHFGIAIGIKVVE